MKHRNIEARGGNAYVAESAMNVMIARAHQVD
jgi:hypothetical protein